MSFLNPTYLLTYTAIAAFLDAGDIWKVGFADVEIEDTYALFHQLELSFYEDLLINN